MLTICSPSNTVNALGMSSFLGERAQKLSSLLMRITFQPIEFTHPFISHLSVKYVDGLIHTDRNKEITVGRISIHHPIHLPIALPHSMHKVLVMRIRMIELERRSLVKGNKHIIRRRDQAERTAGTEIHRVYST